MGAVRVRVLRACLVFLLVLALAGLGAAAAGTARVGGPARAPLDTGAVDRFVEGQMGRHGIPGLTLALIDDGRVAYAKGYGTAGDGRPMTADTPMPIGSISKTFTAVAVLRQVELGRVDLDAPVRRYLPEFEVADPRASRAITVRQLLQQTSGLSDRGYNPVLAPEVSLEEAVRDLRRAESSAEPGTEFHYFNPNYQTLALLVERVTGEPYAEVVAQEVAGPLGLRQTTADYEAIAPRLARGHTKLFGFAVPDDPPYFRWTAGEGGVVSTAQELARVGIAVGLPRARGSSILTPSSLEAMRTPPQVEGTTYGMGWFGFRYRGEDVGGHDGAAPGYGGHLFVLPERGRGYAFLVNQEHLLDVMVAFPQLQQGLLDLLQDRAATEGGLAMRLVGVVLLVVLAVAVLFAVRSFVRLRGWRTRARSMTTGRLVRAIAPHFLLPMVVLAVMYWVVPVLLLDRAFNLAYVGRYFLPDVALLLLLAVVPDLVQGAYMLLTAVAVRRRGARPTVPTVTGSLPEEARR